MLYHHLHSPSEPKLGRMTVRFEVPDFKMPDGRAGTGTLTITTTNPSGTTDPITVIGDPAHYPCEGCL